MAVAQRAHADLQGGAGSGVDIACSLTGGLIEYRMEAGGTVLSRYLDRCRGQHSGEACEAQYRNKRSVAGPTGWRFGSNGGRVAKR